MLRLPPLYLLLALGVLTLIIYFRSTVTSSIQSFNTASTAITPANSTLGFGAVYVVSGPGSPRRDGLVQSANVTELLFTIPDLPSWTGEQIAEFRTAADLDSPITNGSIRAWLSHNYILQDFLKSGLETALILEDDVDWDIRLRTVQTPLAAAGARSILPPADPEQYYWGHPDDWELMYMGHCGDYFTPLSDYVGVGVVHPKDLNDIPHALFHDDTMPAMTDVHPYTASLLTALGVPEKTRVVHKSVSPLCTFGYAITRASARRLVEKLAPVGGATATIPAYDVAILTACRDRGMRCYTINPELFHHMEGASLIDGLDGAKARPPVDAAGVRQVYYRGETSNVGCGFWSKDFRWDGDKQRLAYLKEEVGRKGNCLKPGRTPTGGRIEDERSMRVRRRMI